MTKADDVDGTVHSQRNSRHREGNNFRSVLSEVTLETAVGEIAAVITARSVRGMELKVGDRVTALIKATNVSVRRQN